MDDEVRLAKRLFNEAWELIETAGRTPEQDRRMLLSACASRLHWERAGGDEQRAVGDWQVAHVLSLLGHGQLAEQFARASLDNIERNGWGGYLRASAYEGMARACAASGDAAGRDRWVALARDALAAIDDADDRAVVAGQLRTVPGA